MFNRLSETNFRTVHLPRQSCLVNHSSFKELKTDVLFRSFSVKFVLEGCEQYKIDGNMFKVSKGEYLIGNHFSNGKVLIESSKNVQGLCIDISPEIISDVANAFRSPEITDFDPDFQKFFTTEAFLENKYYYHENTLGKKLFQIGQTILKGETSVEFEKEFYYHIAETIISDHYQCYNRLKSINSIKLVTQKSLYRKIIEAKNYIDKNFSTIEKIEEVAQFCMMSEYHFYRLFKIILNESPYKYIIRKKLNFANQLLIENNFTITDIALISGFNDLSSFSKSYKKQFGFSPKFQTTE